MLRRGEKVIVSIAPAYMGLLKYKTIGQVRSALLRLGFADVRETSEGAALVTAEYARLLEEGTMENIITTCCPSVNDLIEKYYPQLLSLIHICNPSSFWKRYALYYASDLWCCLYVV